MDPMQMYQLQQMLRQRQQGGMFGGQMGQPSDMEMALPQASFAAPQQHSGGEMNPAYMMGLIPGILASGKSPIHSIAPLFGLAGIAAKHFGLFK